VDLEFEKHFEYACFDPNGRTVQEKRSRSVSTRLIWGVR